MKLEEMRRQQDLENRKRLRDELLDAQAKWDREHPEPPPVALRLIGKMGTPRAPLAILATPDGEVHPTRPGEIVAGSYELLAIDFETVTIGYAGPLVAAHPEWKGRRTVLRMGAR